MVVIMWAERGTRSRRFLWLLVKKSPAAAAVPYREVEKGVFQNDLCHPYSCRVVLSYIDAAFQRTDWVSLTINFIQIFSTNAGKRFIYNLSFWLQISFSRCLAEFRRQITTHECKWWSFEGIRFGNRFISQTGIGTGPGMVYGRALEFFFLPGSLQRTWQVEFLAEGEELQIFGVEAVIKS